MRPVLSPLPCADLLVGPDHALPLVPDEAAPVPLTGGGLVVVLDPARGLRGVFDAEARIFGPLDLELAGGPVPGSVEARAGHGVWFREIALEAGWRLRERGLLVDTPPVVVVQWVLDPPPGSCTDAPAPPRAGSHLRITVRRQAGPLSAAPDLPVGMPVTVLLDPGYGETSRTVELLGPLRAREQLRLQRGSPPPRFSLRVDGEAIQGVEAALLTLDDTPLALDSLGQPVPPFLDGLQDGVPRYLDAQALAEVATAALWSDRRPLARSILDLFARVPQTPPPSLLRVAAAWGAWTGDIRPLERLRPALDRAAGDVHGARVPADLSALRKTVSLLSSTTPQSGRAATAARALHDWILDRLGANPDAALGRMRVGPVVADDWHTLDTRGLRVGDALLSLSCRRRKNHFDFLLEQSEGRVPVNLVFEPIFVGWRVDRVRIGGARAEVEVGREPEGTRVRCQFPLDPGRSVTISARPLWTGHRRAPTGP